MDDCTTTKKSWLRFEPTISLGNVLSLLVLAGAVFAWASTVERTLALHGLQLVNAKLANERVASEIVSNRTEIREALKEIKIELKDLNKQMRYSDKHR